MIKICSKLSSSYFFLAHRNSRLPHHHQIFVGICAYADSVAIINIKSRCALMSLMNELQLLSPYHNLALLTRTHEIYFADATTYTTFYLLLFSTLSCWSKRETLRFLILPVWPSTFSGISEYIYSRKFRMSHSLIVLFDPPLIIAYWETQSKEYSYC